jgi:hypothetical protein
MLMLQVAGQDQVMPLYAINDTLFIIDPDLRLAFTLDDAGNVTDITALLHDGTQVPVERVEE